ncbi:unnamed protein product [Ambrosiozyma monospora]|uniref:Unnamed protein product n=1 Tax=Ambrosiozyma monospora TaxID=43982 RepID=A0ACB5TVX4_AMBMO|nr:unnamed protein product [Ambrosiozyma monospora]
MTNPLSQTPTKHRKNPWKRMNGSDQNRLSVATSFDNSKLLRAQTSVADTQSPRTPIDPIFSQPQPYSSSQFADGTIGMTLGNSSVSSIPQTQQQMDEAKHEVDYHLISKFGHSDLIGTGEFSVVYDIQYEGVKYAVKRTKQPLGGPKTRLKKMEEVEILKILRGNNNNNSNSDDEDEGKDYVLNLINYWEHNSYLYIMTDYCENGSLDKFLVESGKVSKLDEWRVWKILVEMLLGLRYVHRCGILHLDLKPANIFVTFEGSLKIGDFGVASKLPIPPFFDREGDREYIAPEVISKHMYGKPADIFSCGLIMVEIAANIILPDNGQSWQKLRSGDLTDAGRLSSTDLTDLDNSLFSTNNTCSSNLTSMAGTSSELKLNQLKQRLNIPNYAPSWFFDGSKSLDKLVSWMIDPNPANRPTADQILKSFECSVVELRRKSGATIYEGDFGPCYEPGDIESMNLEKNLEKTCLKISSLPYGMQSQQPRKTSIDMILE